MGNESKKNVDRFKCVWASMTTSAKQEDTVILQHI